MKRKKHSAVMLSHYVSLAWRGALFITLLVLWIANRIMGGETIMYRFEQHKTLMLILWLMFTIEMGLRFFPSRFRSPGCQKQFAKYYQKTGKTEIIIPDNHGAVLALLIWIVFNLLFGGLHMLGIVDDDFMLLLCSAFSVCDIICILFFCPFQSWIFKNRCCVTCRIYNWDFAMMFTPLFFIVNRFTWSLLAMSLALLIRWEITFYLHPERFSENTNAYLSCAGCTEKLCRHKRQLSGLWKKIDAFTKERIAKLKN